MTTDLPRNHFKAALRAGEPQIGFWLSMASTSATEIAAHAGFDWLLIDMEHTANDAPDVIDQVRTTVGTPAEPVVRVPWNEPVLVKRLLDSGVRSLLFPFVQSAEEARAAVRATRYPPHGTRGMAGTTRATHYGRVPDYFSRASEELCVLVQVETRKSLDAIEEIAAIEGIDGIFIGPGDLSADFGYPGQWTRPEIWAAILDAGRRIRAGGKAVGFLSANEDQCREVLAAGFQFVSVGIDASILARQTDRLVQVFKG